MTDQTKTPLPTGKGIDRLLEVMRRLRAPGGCPWDREQTYKTLKPCLLEETYELLEAMEGDNLTLHREELGDVLLQVVFQCQMRAEEGHFDFNEVADVLADKLIRRHPHVFGDVQVDGTGQVLRNWEAIKQKEKDKAPDRSAIDGVPAALPALLKAQRVQAKASRVGFDWKDASGAVSKIDEELAELKAAIAEGDKAHIEEEMGDLLFAAVNTCRFLGIDAESALGATTQKFSRRFRAVEKAVRDQGREMKTCTLEELDAIWDQVKAAE
ncbi:MAG: nucleoside triphosphate pyrophosphohydrolase [Kiritimatiellae bacterium]|nr:nucleoside triphosphate pyrophosphohydrolase [Kiritimatiellia bacterium]MBP5228256.1 nucleoside triphosphate pyrophosphohydrolase [Kiritimatiellia bacterium]